MPVLRAIAAAMLVVGSLLFVAGVRPRLQCAVLFLSGYALVSYNSLNLHSLGLLYIWMLIPLGVLMDGGGAKPSSERLEQFRKVALAGMLGALYLAGISKLMAGWTEGYQVTRLLNYDSPAFVRPWIHRIPFFSGETFGRLATWGTLILELGLPVLAIVPRFRPLVGYVLAGMFVTFFAMMPIPPLFVFVHLGVAALLIAEPE